MASIALYGPKVAGHVDLSLLAGPFGIILTWRTLSDRVDHRYVVVVLGWALLSSVAVFNVAIFPLAEVVVAGRFLRAFLAAALLGYLTFQWGQSRYISPTSFAKALLLALSANSIAVLLQILMPSLQPAFADIYLFDKGFRSARAFGLTAGFDAAGFLATFGLILAFIEFHRRAALGSSVVPSMLYIGLFGTSVAFTSRTAMIMAGGICLLAIAVFVWKGTLATRAMALLLGASLLFFFLQYAIPLVRATLVIPGVDANPEFGRESSFLQQYAATDVQSVGREMLLLPVSWGQSILGAGIDAPQSDIGYVILVGMVGWVGLVVVLALHWFMFEQCRRLSRGGGSRSGPMLTCLRFVQIATVVLILMNLKGLYFGTRGFHELILVFFMFSLGSCQGRPLGAFRPPASEVARAYAGINLFVSAKRTS